MIYAGSDVGDKYALKVGEVNRDQVAGLITALTGKWGCFVGRKGAVTGLKRDMLVPFLNAFF